MAVHNLAWSLLLLAVFTFSSIVFFEIFTQPPVVKQERELFITAFISERELNYHYDEQISDLNYFTNSPSSTPSGRIGVNVQSTVEHGNRVLHYADGSVTEAESMPRGFLPLPPLSKKDSAYLNGTLSRPKLVAIPMQPSRLRRMQQFIERSPANNTKLAPTEKYVNNIPTPARRMQSTIRRSNTFKPKPGEQLALRRRYVNRNITSARKRVTNLRPPSRPRRLGLNCTDAYCVSYLLDTDYRSFKVCQNWAEKKTRVNHTSINATCKFMKGVRRDPVGLVSVPGSGNTWVRGLLEKATGICTGSIYCDHPLRNGGMIGEYVKTGRVLVVKTHTSDYQWVNILAEKRNNDDAFYGSAILLIRNPFNAFIAEWNRLNALSAYTGRPIEPRNPRILRRGKSEINYRNRSMLAIPSNRGSIKIHVSNPRQSYSHKVYNSSHKRLPVVSKRVDGSVRYHYQRTVSNDTGEDHERVSLVGRKLLSLPAKKLKEDVSHTLEVDKIKFGNNTEWNKYVHAIGDRWKKTIIKWFVASANFSRPVMVVRFEDIKEDHVTQVERMLTFLEFPFDKIELKETLNCGYDSFRRPHKEEFEHYTPEQKKFVNSMLFDTIKILAQHNMEHFFHLEDYLDNS